MNKVNKKDFITTKYLYDLYWIKKKSIPDIALIIGMSYSTTWRLLKKREIKIRTPKEFFKLSGEKISKKSKGRKMCMTTEQFQLMISKSVLVRKQNAKKLTKKPNGYLEFTMGPNKFRAQHRVLIEESIGRKLLPHEIVHHKDHNRSNNDLSNLELMSRSEHSRMHSIKNPQRRSQLNGRFITRR